MPYSMLRSKILRADKLKREALKKIDQRVRQGEEPESSLREIAQMYDNEIARMSFEERLQEAQG